MAFSVTSDTKSTRKKDPPFASKDYFGAYEEKPDDDPYWSPMADGRNKFVTLEDPSKLPEYSTNEDPNKAVIVKMPTRRLLRQRFELSDHPNVSIMEKMSLASDENQMGILRDLQSFSVTSKMMVVQENGQRSAGPPNDYEGQAPPKGSEIFVGRLPRTLYEPQVYDVFSRIGKVYQIRMMMDFAGTNRGYCFLKYFSPDDARRAIALLDNYEMMPRWNIGVMMSVDNCRLLVDGLPKNKSRKQILREMKRVTEGACDVMVHDPIEKDTKNRGYAYVDYVSHKHSAMARRRLIPGRVTVFNEEVCVDWAEPEPDRPALMVRNLPADVSDNDLQTLFNYYSSNGVTYIKRKGWNLAFVDFQSKDQADAARLALDKKEFKGSIVEVRWVKPRSEEGSNTYAHARKTLMPRNSFVSSDDQQMWRAPPPPLPLPNMNQVQRFQRHGHWDRQQQQVQPMFPAPPPMSPDWTRNPTDQVYYPFRR